jgi:glycine betaine/proline transport system permease protein
MTATVESPATPPSAGLEPPPVVEKKSRWRLWTTLGVVVAWVAAYQVFGGKWTLFLNVQDTNGFHRWLNSIKNALDVGKVQGGGAYTVLGWITDALNWIVQELQYLFSEPPAGRLVPIIGWLGVVAIAAWLAYIYAGLRMAVFSGLSLLLCGFLGYWTDSVNTLIIVGVAVAICVVIGIPLGIWMFRSKTVDAIVTPVLDVMQTMPSFAYLAPLALFFGIGNACAVVLTLIYALPPIVRLTSHGLRTVSPTTIEATTALGSTSQQLLRNVQLPMAKRTIIVGLNQTILAALSMAVIAAFVNGPGLGVPVVQALSTLDVGVAFVAGLCIVILAIWLDRTITAASEFGELKARRTSRPSSRRIGLIAAAVVGVLGIFLSNQFLKFAQFPDQPDLGTPLARWVNSFSDWFVNTVDTATGAVSRFVSYEMLNPLQRLLTETPWFITCVVFLALSAIFGGRKAFVSTAVCLAILLFTGVWYESMVTLAMTVVAAILTMILGILFGVWMGRSRRADLGVRPVLDLLQTMPSLIYLIPALALFGATRFTAIVAAVLYAAPVSIKIIADGIRAVSPTTVEAAQAAGTGRWQMITKVQLPMARGATILAANQGLLFVLAVVVIGGLVGGGGLGYLVVAGFAKPELFGKGLAAGIAITALGVMLDRVTRYSAQRFGRTEA